MSSSRSDRPGSFRAVAALGFSMALASLVLAGASPAWAKRAPLTGTPAALPPLAEREIEAVGPPRISAEGDERYGAESGLLRRFWRRGPGASSAAAAEGGAAPLAVARQYLEANAARLGIDALPLDAELSLFSEKRSPSGTHFRWQQIVDGVPVERAEIVVKVSNSGSVSSVQNNLRPGARAVGATSPVIDAARAIAIGVEALAPRGKAIGEFRADLRIVETGAGARLAYVVSLPVEEPLGDWLVFVDAATGRAFALEDRALYVNGTGRVFDPDPETKTNNPNLPDGNDSDAGIPFPAAYDTRTLFDITQNAGVYSLSGPRVRIIDFESPATPPYTATNPDSFQLTRSPSGFEDVSVYFQIDNNQTYIQSLGFTNVNNRVQEIDTHGLSGADNSHYLPSSKRIAFGDGGVDDAEDADVVIHEYGHSIQDNIVPGWGGGQEGAMGEGFGDYWGGSYSRALYPSYQPTYFFNWDGHNEFWGGRILIDSTMHYPEDCCGEVHDSGTLWCSGLWNALLVIGRPVMDRLVIDHHFALGTSATMADAANQIIQSDIDLYGGAHVGDLVRVFGFWGFVDPAAFVPAISHSPLPDTENTAGPFTVAALITSASPLDIASLQVRWGIGGLTDSAAMFATGNPNEYAGSIPGPIGDADVRYYIAARTVSGGAATHPAGAPAAYHEFHVGPDVVPPVIVHAPIVDWAWTQWPSNVRVTATDNIGVDGDAVRVDWWIDGAPRPSFSLARIGATDDYEAPFPSDTSEVAVGDQIDYAIAASDAAAVPNTTLAPPAGTYAFTLIDAAGTAIVLDDDEVSRGDAVSAASIAQALNSAGYVTTVEAANTSNPATWTQHAFVVSSSGANPAPVANAAYRSALESYVAGGGKLLVEGGEVLADAAYSPGYAQFALNVLHSVTWEGNDAGALTLLENRASHPIAWLPNALPATVPISYAGPASEDSYEPLAPAYVVYGVTAQNGNGGVLVYDDTPSPQSAQVVVFGFDYKAIADAATAQRLVENVARFLAAPEGPPTGSISGSVFLSAQSDHSGVVVVANPGGARDTTGADGVFRLDNLYGTTHSVTASKPGWTAAVRNGVLVAEGAETPNVGLVLLPLANVQYCASPSLVIPDNSPAGVTHAIDVPEAFPLDEVEVTVNVTHPYRGNLIVEIRHGGKAVRLHNRNGSGADNIVGTYPTTLAVDGPGVLSDFDGDAANGAWTLFLSDNASGDTGRLNSWCIRVKGPASNPTGVDDDAGDDSPHAYQLAQSEPNPSLGGAATIHFALPSTDRVALGVFDVSGRLVRTLIDGQLPAGAHAARWDGRDGRGREVAAGVYVYRLDAGRFRSARKLIVVR